jgi:gliding motility-associated-like protein
MTKILQFIFFVLLTYSVDGQIKFIENKNQWPQNVLFKTEVEGGQFYLEKNGFTFNFYDTKEAFAYRKQHHGEKSETISDGIINYHSYKVQFSGSNDFTKIETYKTYNEQFNYFLGADKNKWGKNAKAAGEIVYKEFYTGINLKVYSINNHVKYDFILAPAADYKKIRFNFSGVKMPKIVDGKLIVKTSINEVTESVPVTYQIINGEKKYLGCKFIIENNQVGFEITESYNNNIELIIDPELKFSTYSGSFADNFGYTATYDSKGFLYSGSSVFGEGYPVTIGAYQQNWAGGDGGINGTGTDIAISKYDTTGTFLIYSTYLGGSADEIPHSLITDDSDNLYIYGSTGSTNFPIGNISFDNSFNGGSSFAPSGIGILYAQGSDIIVAKLSNDGSELLASSYIGGSGNDGLNTAADLKFNYADEVRGEILLDNDDNVYVVSSTLSTNFPVFNALLQPNNNGLQDGCIVKISNDLSEVIWSSYYGGSGVDAIYSLEVDKNNNIVICGGTKSTDLVVPSSTVQTTNAGGRADGFITRIDKDGNAVESATYYGSNLYDQLYFVELDKSDNVYVYGQTRDTGSNLIFNATYNVPSSGMLVAKFNPNLQSRIWSTVWGTGTNKPNLSPTAFLVDVCNKIYLAGWGGQVNASDPLETGNTNGLPTTVDAIQMNTDGSDFYLMVLEDDASALVYGSFFGGNISAEHVDGGTSRFDRSGKIYQSVCAGCGSHDDFPIYPSNAHSSTNNSFNCNNAVFKIDFEIPFLIASFFVEDVCLPEQPIFTNISKVLADNGNNYLWDFGDGNISTEANPLHNYLQPGQYTIQLIIQNINACNLVDTIVKTIVVYPEINLNLTENIVSCMENSFTLEAITNGSVQSIEWSTENNFSNIFSTDSIINISTDIPQYYYVLCKNSNCTLIDSVLVIPAPNILIESDTINTCNNDAIAVSIVNNTPEILISSILWQPENLIVDGQGNTIASIEATIDTLVLVTITTQQGCVIIDSIYVSVYSIAATDFFATADQYTIELGGSTTLHVNPKIGSYNYEWSPANTLDNSLSTDPLASPSVTTTYIVNINDSSIPIFCGKSDTVTIRVIDYECGEPYIFVPNAFTPNANNSNDFLYVRGNNITKLYFAIYNRWGELVFETYDKTIGWNGKHKDLEVEPAVYVYYLEATCEGELQYSKKGNITLIR